MDDEEGSELHHHRNSSSSSSSSSSNRRITVEEWSGSSPTKLSRTAVLTSSLSSSSLSLQRCGNRFNEVSRRILDAFVPEGFPSSVTPDYVPFQAWDSLQGLSTYIRTMLSTQALLSAIGVGEQSATVIGATFQWFLRDFTGMLGGILFTFYKGSSLDSNAKMWRLVADLMNDLGMLMDLVSPLFPSAFLVIVCVGSISRSFTPPVFNGEGYHVWAARMEAHLEANDLWEAVEEDYEVLPLPANPTMAQIKYHKERKSRKSKARAMLFAAVSSEVFVRIMTLKSAFEVWNFLKKEFEGDEKIKGMKVLNLIREFELQKMKDSETVKEYSDKLLGIANKVRLLGFEFSDSRIVQKIFVTVPERFDATISSLENTKDLSNVSLAELLNALQAQEQRRLMRSEGSVEGALTAKAQPIQGEKEKKNEIGKSGSDSPNTSRRTKFDFPLCKHCGRKGHPPFKCWKRPDQKCEKCQKMGHHKKICRSNTQQTATEENLQQRNVAQVADLEEKEEHLFVASCFATNNTSGKWIVDSGCTNHMTFDRDLFKELDTSITFKVRIGNDKYIVIKGKGTVAIESSSGTKLIKDVLFVPNISQNLLSVGQMIQKGFKVIFETNQCLIKDAKGNDVFKIKMKGKSFALDPLEMKYKVYNNEVNTIEVRDKSLSHSSMLVGYLPNFCAFQFGKQNRMLFPKLNWSISQKLQKIHTDVAEQQRPPPPHGRLLSTFKLPKKALQKAQHFIDTPLKMKKRTFIQENFKPLHEAKKFITLDVFSKQKIGGTIEGGDIRFGNHPKVQETFARISDHSELGDGHSSQVNMKELVVHSTWLRRPPHICRDSLIVQATCEKIEVCSNQSKEEC